MRFPVLLATLAVPVLVFAYDKGNHGVENNSISKTKAAVAAPATGGAKIEINIDGMHCQACVDNLTKQLDAMTDIEKGSVTVDLKGNKARLTLKKGATGDFAAETLKKNLNAKLESAGFTVTDVKTIN